MTSSDKPSGRMAGRVVLITGTGDGQGRAAALRFLAEGARVVGCDLNADAAKETSRQAAAVAGAEYRSFEPADLTDPEAVAAYVDFAVAEFGGIDAVYNNAAGARLGAALTMSPEDFDFNLAGVVKIPWLVTKAATPYLAKSSHAAILNTSSVSGIVGAGMVGNAPLLSIYGVAKAALLRLTQTMAVELGELGVRVNSVSPGLIDTPAVAGIIGDDTVPELRRAHVGQLLIPRIGTPDDVVDAALFLLSDEASYITGQNLIVDGGWTASGGVGFANADVMDALNRSLGGGLRY